MLVLITHDGRVCGRVKLPGGMSHWGLHIIRLNHSLKGTLNEDEASCLNTTPRVRTRPAPEYRSQIPYPFCESSADLSGGSVNLIPFFPPSYFPVFDTLNAIRALRAGWWKEWYPFYAFLFRRMMYRPQMRHAPRGVKPKLNDVL